MLRFDLMTSWLSDAYMSKISNINPEVLSLMSEPGQPIFEFFLENVLLVHSQNWLQFIGNLTLKQQKGTCEIFLSHQIYKHNAVTSIISV